MIQQGNRNVDFYSQGQYDMIIKFFNIILKLSQFLRDMVWIWIWSVFFFSSYRSVYRLRGHKGAEVYLQISFNPALIVLPQALFFSPLMSDVELGNDKRRVKTAGRMETSWGWSLSSSPTQHSSGTTVGGRVFSDKETERKRDPPGDGGDVGREVAGSVRRGRKVEW